VNQKSRGRLFFLSFSLRTLQRDILAGFTVSLLALPLCIGISAASGFPPVAGVFTAIIGGILVSFISGAHLTIKGPAAGLIVIALGAVTELGNEQPAEGYRYALASIVIAGIIQVILGLARAGMMADFFPHSVVKGMLSAIGLIIAVRQFFPMMGYKPQHTDFFSLLTEIPSAILNIHPVAGGIGLFSLVFLIVYPHVLPQASKKLPGPLLMLAAASLLAYIFGLESAETSQSGHTIRPANFMVQVPSRLIEGITLPDFSRWYDFRFLKYVVLFSLVGTLETLVSAKAVESMDPWRRHAPLNRDLTGVGVGNVMAGMVGGLPMITEIVRSSANINSGARTWWSNVFHGIFLLGFLTLFTGLIQRVPLSALGALLVYTGYQLARPDKFIRAQNVGVEQVLVMSVTTLLTVFTDLLIGLLGGTLAKYIFLLTRGLDIRYSFRVKVRQEIQEPGCEITLALQSALVFCNFFSLRRTISLLPVAKKITIDFRNCPLVDHTSLQHLQEIGKLRLKQGGAMELKGLETMISRSQHPLALRIQKKQSHPNV
jgi:MFS superfamily sulfate permease-like transporter